MSRRLAAFFLILVGYRMSDVFEFLCRVSFFKDLRPSEVRFVARYARVDTFPSGHILFRENDPAFDFFIVKQGLVQIWKNHGTAEQALLAEQGEGQIFGEMALVDDQNRSATVITARECVLVAISHKDLAYIMKKRPAVMFTILRSLSQMMRRSNDLFIENLSHQNDELRKVNLNLQTAQNELLKAERFSNLGKFASFILHDLRNPIAMIKGYAEMLILETERGSSMSDYGHKIVLEADHVHRFANELLDYSRGDIRLNYVLTSIENVFGKLHDYVKDSFERRQIRMKMVNKVNSLVMIDSERILRVLINITDNAKKASRAGGEVSVEAEILDGLLVFRISDQGDGMSQEDLSRIFEPFYSNSPQGGTGLGMLIVKNVVESHQGTIDIKSEVGKGTTMLLRLPTAP